MRAVRRSHSTLSKGETFPSVNRRWNSSPVARRVICCVSAMLFHTVLVSAILPPRRQWCHVHVSRGAVREQNLHSTPKWRPEGEVKCTVLVHENILSGEQPELRTASSAARAEKKETK